MTNGKLPFLAGGGAMGAAIAAHPWAETPLGPAEDWPAALKITVSTLVNSAFPQCLFWGPELISIYNDAFIPLLAEKHPSLGRTMREVWAEAWDEIGPIAARAMSGHPTFIEDFELELARSGHIESAFFTFCYSPVRDETGAIYGMLDTVVETTGKVRAERMSRLRNRELAHRSRNAYALVSALIGRTHRSSASKEEAQEKLQMRIASLVRAQDALVSDEAPGADVSEVVARSLEPFRDANGVVETDGPAVRLGSEQTTSLALALHELGTNALKYGALSVAGGRVSVQWSIEERDGRPLFRLEWSETGGPPAAAPSRRGFGSALIQEALARSLGGEAELSFPPDGVRFTLTADVAGLDPAERDA